MQREVILTEEIWIEKILRSADRACLTGFELTAQVTIEQPEFLRQDIAYVNRECFYRAGFFAKRPDRFLKVVVVFESTIPDGLLIGRVVTAYPTDKLKAGETPLWLPE